MQTSLSEYLIEKGHTMKKASQGEQTTNCLWCDNENNKLYVNDERGVFHCKVCDHRGNIWVLKKHYNDIPISSRKEKKTYKKPESGTDITYVNGLKKEGYDFLTKRGFTEETIKAFNLGQYKDFITIPFYKDGFITNFKYRGIAEKKFQRFKDAESTLFNIDRIDPSKDIWITEGEFDAVACYQLGHKNVVSVPTGASAFNPEWIDFFDTCTGDFIIAYDNDPVGEEGGKKLAQKLGIARCKRVLLAKKDINDCLLSGDTLFKYRDYNVENFIHISEAFDRLDVVFQQGDRGCGKQLAGMSDLNERLGGLRRKEVTVVTGDTSSGKSTFVEYIFYRLVVEGERVLIVSSEMAVEEIMQDLWCMYVGKSFNVLTDEDYQNALKWFVQQPIYFIDVLGRVTIDQIREAVEYGTRKYNIGYVLLDHLHFFIKRQTQSQEQDISSFMFEIIALSRKHDINTWLVAHPSKLDNNKGIGGMNNLKGASAIKQDAHNVIWMRRVREENDESIGADEVIINLEKVRHKSGRGGKKRYGFDMGSLHYMECF